MKRRCRSKNLIVVEERVAFSLKQLARNQMLSTGAHSNSHSIMLTADQLNGNSKNIVSISTGELDTVAKKPVKSSPCFNSCIGSLAVQSTLRPRRTRNTDLLSSTMSSGPKKRPKDKLRKAVQQQCKTEFSELLKTEILMQHEKHKSTIHSVENKYAAEIEQYKGMIIRLTSEKEELQQKLKATPCKLQELVEENNWLKHQLNMKKSSEF